MVLNYKNADCSSRKKFLVSFIITFVTLSFRIKRNVLQHEKLKTGLFAFYDIRSGNGAGLFSQENRKR